MKVTSSIRDLIRLVPTDNHPSLDTWLNNCKKTLRKEYDIKSIELKDATNVEITFKTVESFTAYKLKHL
jgi:hypothetical protein